MNSESRKKIQFPHSYVIIICVLLFACIMTYVIPAGEYARYENSAGLTVVDPDTFKFVPNTPVALWRVPEQIMNSAAKNATVVFSIFIIGGAFGVILATGAFEALTAKMAKRFAGKETWLIPAFSLIFALATTTMANNQFIGFAPIGVMVALAFGFDAVVGCGMICLGGATGFSTGTFNVNTTGIAQEIAELPLFSGLWLRCISFVIFLVVTDIYLISYAKKIKADPRKSVMYGLQTNNTDEAKTIDDFQKMNKKHVIVLLTILAFFIVLIYGCANYKWGLAKVSVVFMYMSVASGLLYGFGPSRIAKEYIKGMKDMTEPAIIIAMGCATTLILSEGHVLDTVVRSLAQGIGYLPYILRAPGMYILQTVTNFFIVAGNAQAAVAMPIMVPVADMVGVSRQTAVLAFNFGDGLSNYILPHSSALMGFIGMANIPYDRWMRFMLKLFAIWAVVAMIIVAFASVIQYS